ncbi:MAG: deoxyribodipyrimidine photo-lyase [Luteibaculaceae bacterium]|jgi:deoxyribodipyrimidine photo-lyase
MKRALLWLQKDLRLKNNAALNYAFQNGYAVALVYVHDPNFALNKRQEALIAHQLQALNQEIKSEYGLDQGILCKKGKAEDVFKNLKKQFANVPLFWNRVYEPERTTIADEVSALWGKEVCFTFPDSLCVEPSEVLKPDGLPYVKFTPYFNKWKAVFANKPKPKSEQLPTLWEIEAPSDILQNGDELTLLPILGMEEWESFSVRRDVLALSTSRLGPYVSLGFESAPYWATIAEKENNLPLLRALAWRDFFVQIMVHFPRVIQGCFLTQYNSIPWENNPTIFDAWCRGETGVDVVDAGMKELLQTGYMDNRVRMIAASFLIKNACTDWRWGEAFFAEHLLDFDQASNNGNWQWVDGTGCDAAPYFRVFSPERQEKKFDPKREYINRWLRNTARPQEIVNLKAGKEKAMEMYKAARNK